MSEAHEAFLAQVIGGKVVRGSGAGWANKLDVRNAHWQEPYALALDGKSTFAKSISVSLAMWDKVVEQAHYHQPGMALRFYHDARLQQTTDLIVVEAGWFSSLLSDARDHALRPPEPS